MSASDTGRLLHTKLIPPRLPSVVVQRDDLLARLDEGLTRKVSLVRRDVPFVWVTLDDYDNDSVRFWTYVCSGLRMLDPSLGKATLSILASPQPPSFESLLTPLINDLTSLPADSALVLEDYHAIQSPEINKGVSFLIQHLPETLHLVFITRTTPDLQLAILRVREELVEVNAADLRFNQEETQTFVTETVKMTLPSSAVIRLSQKTEGWPAGLRLVTLALQNRASAEIETLIESFSGSDRYIADYLIKEVFERQPLTVQAFLLKTSFFKRLTGSLCDAVLEVNHSAAMLEQLERENLFLMPLERKGEQVWYRYSSLFAETLQHLARQRFDEASITTLFERASKWYAYHGLFDEAIDTALTAKLFDQAMDLIETFIEIHDMSEMHTIGRWLAKIPEQEILRHPVIAFTNAQLILYSTDRFAPATAARIEPFLSAAEAAWRTSENHQRLGQLLAFRGNVTWWQGDFPRAFAYAHQSLAELPEHDIFWRGDSLISVGHEALAAGQILDAQDKLLEARALLGAAQNIFGVLAATQFLTEVFFWQGELEQAEQLNLQIQREAVGHESMLDDQGFASLNLAHIAYERNHVDQAEPFAMHALELAKQRANEMLQVQATLRLAYISFARENAADAFEFLKSLEANIQNPALLREIQQVQALLAIQSNNISSLNWWVKIISDKNQNALHLQKEREAFTLARLQIAQGKAKQTFSSLKQWQGDAARNGRIRSQLEALCLQALAYHADGNTEQAARSLGEALAIGYPKGFRRIFLDEGPRIAALLQAMLPRLTDRSLHLFAAALLHSFSPAVTSHVLLPGSSGPIEALSQQELRVLRLLIAGLSNADIAKELIVSTNTVKTHVKSIYRKLNVTSRNEARQVARELKLV